MRRWYDASWRPSPGILTTWPGRTAWRRTCTGPTAFGSRPRAGLLSQPLAEQLAPSAGLRNRLVHEYDEIDDAVVLRAVGEARRLFREYVAAIERYVRDGGF